MSRPISSARAKDVETQCYTVGEFCLAHRIGLNTYYKIRKAGKGPKEMHPPGTKKVLITKESAARWRAARDTEAKREGT